MPMQCTKCGFDNPDDVKFCQKCANVFSNDTENSSEQNLHQQNNLDENQESKKIKIILLITGILIVGGLGFAGYYYKDKIFKDKTGQNLTQKTSQTSGQLEKEKQEEVEEELIFGNYNQLVLTEDDVLKKLWFMELDNDESGEIRNLADLELFESDTNTSPDTNVNFMGGYQNVFGVDAQKVFARVERGELEGDINYMNVLAHKIVVLKSTTEAKGYLGDIRKDLISDFEKIAEESGENFGDTITDLDNVGDEGFEFNLFKMAPEEDNDLTMLTIFFRIKNSINILDITGEAQYFSENNILHFLNEIESKYREYKPSDQESETLNYSLDSDNDGLKNYMEERHGTDKNNPDTDGDGYEDGDEVQNCYNPLGLGRLVEDNFIELLTDKDYLEAQGLYYLKPNESIGKFHNEKGILSDLEIIRIENIATGIFVPENVRYYLIISGSNEITGDKFYFDEMGYLKFSCPSFNIELTDEEKQKCQILDSKNNFEIDCKRLVE